jgi:hypothetical protein
MSELNSQQRGQSSTRGVKPMITKDILIRLQTIKFLKSGNEVTKVTEGDRAMQEFVWYKETYPKNYTLRYKK